MVYYIRPRPLALETFDRKATVRTSVNLLVLVILGRSVGKSVDAVAVLRDAVVLESNILETVVRDSIARESVVPDSVVFDTRVRESVDHAIDDAVVILLGLIADECFGQDDVVIETIGFG